MEKKVPYDTLKYDFVYVQGVCCCCLNGSMRTKIKRILLYTECQKRLTSAAGRIWNIRVCINKNKQWMKSYV